MHLQFLEVRDQPLDPFFVRFFHVFRRPKHSLATGRFLGEDMPCKRPLHLHFSRPGLLKPFGRSAVRLQFWHVPLSFSWSIAGEFGFGLRPRGPFRQESKGYVKYIRNQTRDRITIQASLPLPMDQTLIFNCSEVPSGPAKGSGPSHNSFLRIWGLAQPFPTP